MKQREGGRLHGSASGHFSGEADSPRFQSGITSHWGWVKITGSHTLNPSVRPPPRLAGWLAAARLSLEAPAWQRRAVSLSPSQ